MSAPFASVCLLAFERPRLLEESIYEIHRTAGYPFELIVHDDGSSDRGVDDVLHRARAEGVVSTVIHNSPGRNQGVGVAINRMFKIAEGDVLVKLDADLTYTEGWLANTAALLERNDQRARPSVEPTIGMLGLLHYDHAPVASADCKLAEHEGWDEQTHVLGSAFAMTRWAWEVFGEFEQYSSSFSEDWARMKQITGRHGWACALPSGESFVENPSMGLGKSTVVNPDGTIHAIHTTPRVFG